MARRDNSGTVRCVTEIISAVAPTKRWFRRGRPRTTHLTEGTPAIGIAPDDATDPVGEFCALWAARLHEMHTSWGSQGVVLTVLTVSRTDATPDQLAALALLLPDLLDRKSLCDAVNLLLGAKHADARVVRPLTIEEFSSVLRTSRPAELESPVDSLDRAFGLGFADLFSRVVISHNKSYTLDELLEALAGTEHAIPLVLRGWNNDAMTLPAVFEKVRALPRTGAEVASHLVLSGSDESFDDLCLLAESLLQDAGTPESLQTV
jgi:hypothetical protein